MELIARITAWFARIEGGSSFSVSTRALPMDHVQRQTLALTLLGNPVHFAYRPEGERARRVIAVTANGMVDVEGLDGQFAPHLFVLAYPADN